MQNFYTQKSDQLNNKPSIVDGAWNFQSNTKYTQNWTYLLRIIPTHLIGINEKKNNQ